MPVSVQYTRGIRSYLLCAVLRALSSRIIDKQIVVITFSVMTPTLADWTDLHMLSGYRRSLELLDSG